MSDFVKNNAPSGKKSKLDNFVKEILGLKNLGYFEKDILRFLHKKRGITVSQPTLNRFVRSRAGKTSTVDETRDRVVDNPVQAESRQAVSQPVLFEKQPEEQFEPEKMEHPVIGKFDLNSKIDAQDQGLV